jgi:TolA-binding protein
VSEIDQTGERAMDARLRQHGEALRAERDGCPHPELLFARQSEALDADVRDRIHVHVATCQACRRLAEDFEGLGLAEPDAEVEARVLARVTGSPHRGRAGLLSLAAGLLVASGLGVTWWYTRGHAPAPAPPVASQSPGVPVASPAPPPGTVVALWTITPARVRLPLSSLGVSRSGGTGATPSGDVLVAALAPYQLGDYTGAVARLSAVVRDFPESGEAHFYLGVSYLMAGDAIRAVDSLDHATSRLPEARRAEAEWYQATAEQRAGRTDEARARVRVLCAQPGEHQADACAAEASLK